MLICHWTNGLRFTYCIKQTAAGLPDQCRVWVCVGGETLHQIMSIHIVDFSEPSVHLKETWLKHSLLCFSIVTAVKRMVSPDEVSLSFLFSHSPPTDLSAAGDQIRLRALTQQMADSLWRPLSLTHMSFHCQTLLHFCIWKLSISKAHRNTSLLRGDQLCCLAVQSCCLSF